METDTDLKEIIMCITPKTMTIDLCKSCKRYSIDETEASEVYKPTKGLSWKCDGYINIMQGNLFDDKQV